MTSQSVSDRYDVIIVGGGHNGLVAAAYLARAGLSVLVLERLDHTGGAAVSAKAFPGLPARLSRYSYLVSLMPQQIIDDLGLDLELRSRDTASYSPVVRDGQHTGLFVERPEAPRPPRRSASSPARTGSTTPGGAFYGEIHEFAEAVAPTLLEPLRTGREMRELVDPATWDYLVETPIGNVIEERFADDTVRGVVATDALIGTFADLHDPGLVQNRCFLYHLVGNGTGEWRVPVGGMGAVTDSLAVAARNAGATCVTGAGVSGIETDGDDGDRDLARRRHLALGGLRLRALQRGALGAAGAARRGAGRAAGGLPAQGQPAAGDGCPGFKSGESATQRLRRHAARRGGLQPAAEGVRRGGGRAGARARCRASSTATPSPTPRSSGRWR